MASDSDRRPFPDGPTVYHQLRWDPRFDASACEIVLTDRPAGTKTIAFREFVPNGPIPWHRIVAFRYRGEVLWDRTERIDRRATVLQGSAKGSTAPVTLPELEERAATVEPGERVLERIPTEWSLLTWNVMHDGWEGALVDHHARWRRLIDDVFEHAPTFVVFTEARDGFLEILRADGRLRADYSTFHTSSSDVVILSRVAPSRSSAVQLAPGRSALVVWFETVTIAGLHLLGDREASRRAERERDLDRLHHATLGAAPVVLAGDFNASDSELDGFLTRFHGIDGWSAVRPGELGSTYDVVKNPLAAALTNRGRSSRLDRVVLLGEGLEPATAELVGTHQVQTSDHFGLVVGVRPRSNVVSKQTAVVVTPPLELWGPLQRLRARHDDRIDRWPPHLTLLFGFVEPAVLEPALRKLATAITPSSPFQLRLDRVVLFEHETSVTVGLAPSEEAPLRALQQRLVTAFPHCVEQNRGPDGRFTPHLTVARLPRSDVATLTGLRRELAELTLEWTVGGIDVLERGDDAFERRATIALSTGTISAPVEAPAPPLGHLRESISEALTMLGLHGTIEPFGSRVWGPSLESSDVDLFVKLERGASSFLDVLAQHHPEARRTGRSVLRGDDFDVVALDADAEDEDARRLAFGPLDARVLRRRLDRHGRAEAFDTAIPLVRSWARSRGLEGNAFGYFGGLGWAVLLAAPLIDDARLCAVSPKRAFEAWCAWASSLGERSAIAIGRQLVADEFTILAPAEPPRPITRAMIGSTRKVLLDELRHLAEGRAPLAPEVELLVRGPRARAGEWLRCCLTVFSAAERELGPVLRPFGAPLDSNEPQFSTRVGLFGAEVSRARQCFAHHLARLGLSDVGVFVRPVEPSAT